MTGKSPLGDALIDLYEEVRNGGLTLVMLSEIQRAEQADNGKNEALLYGPKFIEALRILNNDGVTGIETNVGKGLYYSRLQFLQKEGLIEPVPVKLEKQKNRFVSGFRITPKGKIAIDILKNEIKRILSIVEGI